MSDTIYTIGHSNHTIDAFLALLDRHRIEVIADVRSSPFSRRHPQFSRDDLKQKLAEAGIRYVFLGHQLGARPKDRSCYVEGRVSYHRLASTETFQVGLKRLMSGSTEYRIAMLCAEKDPLDCHRTILVARRLAEQELEVVHILADGTLEKHAQAMERLLAMMRLRPDDLFLDREAILRQAYDRQGEKIAFSEVSESVGER
ncbi:MAG: DUF488 family protein [Verrucomicrobia bacterium]|jgi:uncharacterized protein (DUF488 family)|nr:DUF488 family protein [Verrucomicrobiota bacterium]